MLTIDPVDNANLVGGFNMFQIFKNPNDYRYQFLRGVSSVAQQVFFSTSTCSTASGISDEAGLQRLTGNSHMVGKSRITPAIVC